MIGLPPSSSGAAQLACIEVWPRDSASRDAGDPGLAGVGVGVGVSVGAGQPEHGSAVGVAVGVGVAVPVGVGVSVGVGVGVAVEVPRTVMGTLSSVRLVPRTFRYARPLPARQPLSVIDASTYMSSFVSRGPVGAQEPEARWLDHEKNVSRSGGRRSYASTITLSPMSMAACAALIDPYGRGVAVGRGVFVAVGLGVGVFVAVGLGVGVAVAWVCSKHSHSPNGFHSQSSWAWASRDGDTRRDSATYTAATTIRTSADFRVIRHLACHDVSVCVVICTILL